jgi:hypothetical protein
LRRSTATLATLAVLALPAETGACAGRPHVDVMGFAVNRFPTVRTDEVRLFDTVADIPGTSVPVALLTVRRPESGADSAATAAMIAALQRKAGRLGANGLILGRLSPVSSGPNLVMSIDALGGQAPATMTVTAVRWVPPEAAGLLNLPTVSPDEP